MGSLFTLRSYYRSCVSPPALAADFDSSNSERLSVTASALDFSSHTDMTIEVWFNKNALGAHGNLIGKTATVQAFFLQSRTDNVIRFNLGTSDGAKVANSAANTADAWHQAICYHDSSGELVGLIVDDGTPVTAATSGGTPLDGTAHPFNFSHDANAGGQPFDGRMQVGRVWSRLLTSGEITALYNSGSPVAYCALTSGQKVGLVSNWDMGEYSDGTGAVTRNDSHGTNHLTDTNTVASIARDA